MTNYEQAVLALKDRYELRLGCLKADHNPINQKLAAFYRDVVALAAAHLPTKAPCGPKNESSA